MDSLYTKLFGGVFSRIEECTDRWGVINSPLYARATKMLEIYMEKGLDNSVLEEELVNWIDSTVLDGLKKDSSFFNICFKGYFELAKWFLEKYPKFDVHACKEHAFLQICRGGHLDMVKWFLERYPETDIHSRNEHAFRIACRNGHLDVAKWLVDTYPSIDVHDDEDDAFYRSCEYGQFEVVKWLLEKYPETDLKNDVCFLNSCWSGNTDLARLFIDSVKETVIYSGFITACKNGWIDIVKLIVKLYPDIRLYDISFGAICEGGNIELAKWYLEVCPDIDIQEGYSIATRKKDTLMMKFLEGFSRSDSDSDSF